VRNSIKHAKIILRGDCNMRMRTALWSGQGRSFAPPLHPNHTPPDGEKIVACGHRSESGVRHHLSAEEVGEKKRKTKQEKQVWWPRAQHQCRIELSTINMQQKHAKQNKQKGIKPSQVPILRQTLLQKHTSPRRDNTHKSPWGTASSSSATAMRGGQTVVAVEEVVAAPLSSNSVTVLVTVAMLVKPVRVVDV